MSVGRAFQIVGLLKEKLRGPYVTVLVRGTMRSPLDADFSWLRVGLVEIRVYISERYTGAVRCMHLYTNAHSLKSTMATEQSERILTKQLRSRF